jgi:branched-chain amino acid transport system substrate-binding protein
MIGRKLFITIIRLVSTFILAGLLLFSCQLKRSPYIIGISTTLSGETSTIGIQERNGAILAIEEINKTGGVNKRRLVYLIEDDQGSIETSQKVDLNLIDQGAIALIGHFQSTLIKESLPIINNKKIPMFTPAGVTSELSFLDDYLFRLINPIDERTPIMAEYIKETLGVQKMAIIYDIINPSFTEGYYNHFKNAFEQIGGSVVLSVQTNKETSYSKLAEQVAEAEAEGVLVVIPSYSSAIFCQNLRKRDPTIVFFDSSWGASTNDFISLAGDAAENVYSITTFNGNNSSPEYQTYTTKYSRRFSEASTMHDLNSYEAVYIIAEALKKKRNPKKLKETILRIDDFSGPSGKISFNEYGDPQRALYIQKIKDSKLEVVEVIQIY